jgi:tripartite-type tricarboxylate transporter receptor subunit TctC
VDAGFTDNYNLSLLPLFLGGDPSKHYPDTPTLTQLGYGDLAMGIYYVICAPKGTPREILARLEAAFAGAVTEPKYIEVLDSLKWDAIWRDSGSTAAAVRTEAGAVRDLIDKGLITAEE